MKKKWKYQKKLFDSRRHGFNIKETIGLILNSDESGYFEFPKDLKYLD
ncbi:hypothetical protein HN587_00720 [Candidatus Woesearchaeota archaeon]|jgi:hypothetical protein|nr:hypothetical protein [Candidatus Woesearchaeota archaeon]